MTTPRLNRARLQALATILGIRASGLSDAALFEAIRDALNIRMARLRAGGEPPARVELEGGKGEARAANAGQEGPNDANYTFIIIQGTDPVNA